MPGCVGSEEEGREEGGGIPLEPVAKRALVA